MITEKSIRYFIILSQQLNYSKAADILGVSQQNVSKMILKLEHDLGVALFDRNHHYVRLTNAGEQFYTLFQRFTDEFSAVCICAQEENQTSLSKPS